MEHTKEPWVVRDKYDLVEIIGAENTTRYIISEDLEKAGVNLHEITRADYRRIVACVNACAGVPIEVLEGGIFDLAVWMTG